MSVNPKKLRIGSINLSLLYLFVYVLHFVSLYKTTKKSQPFDSAPSKDGQGRIYEVRTYLALNLGLEVPVLEKI